MFLTLGAEQCGFSWDCLEVPLAHSVPDVLGRAYNRTEWRRADRADIRGDAREAENFFPVLLGTSEASASAKLAEMGKTTAVGQEARLLCPDCEAGAGFRAFSTLDECGAPALGGWRALSAEARGAERARAR